MNPNIGLERKTGPITEEGKAVSRLNALKTGQYSELLNELECNYCKRRDFCQFFKSGEKCSLRGEISKSILIDQLDIAQETKELYKLCIATALWELMFNKKTAGNWIELASRQLNRMVDIKAIDQSTGQESKAVFDLREFREKIEEARKRNRGDITTMH